MFSRLTRIRSSFLLKSTLKVRARDLIKPGECVVHDGAPHKVVGITQGKRGKGGGFVRAKLKNLMTSNTYEITYTSDEMVEHAQMEKQTVHFSWDDGSEYVFMNQTTFEEVRILKDDVDKASFLLENVDIVIRSYKGKTVMVELPIICEYKVVSVNGNTAELNSGAQITVPPFVEAGMKIRVNTQDEKYVERA